MKKQLLIGSLLLLSAVGFAQQKSAANVSADNASSYSSGSMNVGNKTFAPLAVMMPTTSTCMSINLPVPATWSLVNYGVGTPIFIDGFVNGPNMYSDKEKAMFFDASATANTMLTQVYVAFDKAYSATPTKTVGIKVYNGTGTVVGTALGSGTLTMATIMNDVTNNQYSLVMFPTPITLPASKKFFVSVDLSALTWTNTPKDSLSVVSNSNTQSPASLAYEKWSNNTWSSITSSWALNISLLIHPFLTQAPIVANISNSTNTICAGQNVTYSTTGSTAGTYEWDFGAIPSPTATGATTMATYPTAGTFTTLMVVEDACGSFGIGTKTVLVKPNPTVTATPPSTTVCNGTNISLSGGGASTYAWTGGIGDATPFAATSTTNYTVTGTAANGCTATAVAAVSVNPIPNVTANTTTNTVCAGSNITLTGGGATTYAWTGGVNDGVAFAPASSGSYTVTGTANSCTAVASVSITLVPTPTVTAGASSTLVCSGSTITLNGGGATTYTWTGGATDGVAFVPTNTVYTVTGAGSNGCTSTASIAISISPCTGINAQHSSMSHLTIYPNPNNGEFVVSVSGLSGAVSVEIHDGLGKLVHKQNITSEKQNIKANLSQGMYFISLIENGKVVSVQKMISR